MSQVKFKFMERLGTNLNLSNAQIADGDMVNIAIGKLQGQLTNKVGLDFSGTNISGTIGSNGVSLSVANPSGGGGGVAVSAGTNSTSTGTVQFSNANNVSFGMNTNGVITAAGGGALSANGGVVTSGTFIFSNANNVSFGIDGNTLTASFSATGGGAGGAAISAGTNSRNSGTVNFSNANNVSFGMDTNGNLTAAGGGALSAGSTMATGGTVVFSNANNVSFGMDANTVTASIQDKSYRLIGNTVGSSLVTGNEIFISGGNNVTLSGTSNTIVVSAGDGGGGGIASRLFIEINQGERLTTVRNLSETRFSNRPCFFPFWVEGTGVPINTVRFFVSGVGSSNRSLGMTFKVGLYSQLNSNQMTLLTTDSMGYSITASSQSSVWNGPSILDFTGMSGFTQSAQGRYLLALNVSVVSANATWANMAIYGCDNYPSFSRIFSNNTTGATNQTYQLLPWQGVFSTTSSDFPSIVSKNQIYGGNSASGMQPYAVIMGI